MIRVLHVFPCFNQGGIENFVMNVYKTIDRSQVQFDFAFLYKRPGVFDDDVKNMGAHIYYFDSEKKSLRNYRKSLKRIIKEHGPFDAIHSHEYFFSGYILKIAKACGVHIRLAHSHDAYSGYKKNIFRTVYEWYMRHLISKYATCRLACSDMAGKYCFGKRISFLTLYNGIDVGRFSFDGSARNEVRFQLDASDSFFILHVGRFTKLKNHSFLISVFYETLKRRPNAKLVLIGDGELKGEVVLLIRRLGIEDKVVILSNVKDTERYYSAADVFVFPSLFEGLGIVAVEAQANGLPCVVSDRVPKEVELSNNVIRLSLSDPVDVWAEAILSKDLKRDSRSTIGNESPFNIVNTAKTLTEIYCGKKSF